MAGATVTVTRQHSLTERDQLRRMYEQLNAVVTDLETLRAELVAETTSVLAAGALIASPLSTAESGD